MHIQYKNTFMERISFYNKEIVKIFLLYYEESEDKKIIDIINKVNNHFGKEVISPPFYSSRVPADIITNPVDSIMFIDDTGTEIKDLKTYIKQ